MKVTIEWLTSPKGFGESTTRSEWSGEMDTVPRVGEIVQLYGPEKDEDGFHEALDHGKVVVVIWQLHDDFETSALLRVR